MNRVLKKIDVIPIGRFSAKRLERAPFVDQLKDVKSPKTMPTAKSIWQ